MADEQIKLGPYNNYIRDHYLKYRIAKYMIDHPEVKESVARRYARVAWARKVSRANNRHLEVLNANRNN